MLKVIAWATCSNRSPDQFGRRRAGAKDFFNDLVANLAWQREQARHTNDGDNKDVGDGDPKEERIRWNDGWIIAQMEGKMWWW